MKITEAVLLARLRDHERWRPVRWAGAALLADGYCCIERGHIYVERTPKTVGLSVSPASAGVREAIAKWGADWELVWAPSRDDRLKASGIRLGKFLEAETAYDY
jgi:hypothetical protein